MENTRNLVSDGTAGQTGEKVVVKKSFKFPVIGALIISLAIGFAGGRLQCSGAVEPDSAVVAATPTAESISMGPTAPTGGLEGTAVEAATDAGADGGGADAGTSADAQ